MSKPLSDDEVAKLRSLVPLADQIKQEAEYRAAQRLVLQTWRQGLIFFSSMIAAIYVFRDQIINFFGGKS